MTILDPSSQPGPERDERQRATTTHLEIRPRQQVAELAVRALACPSCEMPIRIAEPISWSEPVACGFCEAIAPGREFVRDDGWPPVRLTARIG